MITHGFYSALARLHMGEAGARITRIGFGTSGAAEAMTDTALSDDAYLKPLLGVSVVTDPDELMDPQAVGRTLRFAWVLHRHEAVGLAIRELGLFTEDGTLVARQVRDGPIPKAADMELRKSFDLQL